MAKSDFKDSLKKQMLTMTLVPVVLLTVAIIVTSVSIVRASITNQIEDELIHDAELIGFVFDDFYVGDYRIEETGEEGEIEIYKGEQKLNGEDTLIATMSDFLDIDVSIFIEDTRILTTLHDEDGNSAMGTKAAAVVKNEVLKTGESVFYDNVVVYDKKSFAYYTALKDEKDEVIGMIAVCRSAEDVQEEVFKYVLPIIAICVVVAVFFGFIMVHEGNKLAGRIFKMDKYMNRLANGEFDFEMPRELIAKDDEIKHLATDGKRMAGSLKKLVEYDALTELNNRRSADKKLEEIRVKAVEMGNKYCVCISDIDFFKKVNDTYGHEIGDVILKSVADKLKAGMVGKGFSARWGGEEFLLIFENRELDIARRELSMIMDEVRTIYIPDTNRQITMSFGLTALVPGENTDETLKRADNNLYEAKETGRNQIICK
ncbi:diguanylate cyclase (GGDEF) domain-containing protein [Pseudobutyrivibrio sp. JW11]|uniref:diguanylate cyclase domain-containing protein n=1 Tax=Pseudobutyrivibrio sp. JW11 TaxID=1855302 RepID=UPI0008F4203F|nr:diguanylate cyclase [Pseudobutyrivibrio sp. JW11]SFN79558.1 diguanylate cyclase (GGDEF) domain-containing protein [Pseudobutyrivibrio sp. JW11]